MRKGVSLGVALMLVGSISYLGVHKYDASHAATGGSIYVNPSSATIAPGQATSMTIRENSGSTGVDTVQASLTYDAAKLQYVSITEGGDFTLVGPTSTGTSGIIRVARSIQAGGTALTGDHPVVTVNFKVLGSSGTTALNFDSASTFLAAGGQPIPQGVTGGSYTIQGASPPPPPVGFTQDVSLSLNPSNGNLAPGSTLTLSVLVNSPTQGVTSIEPIITYPANLLQYVSTSNSSSFPTAMRTKDTNGTLDIIRGINGGDPGFKGNGTVAKVSFKVIGTSGTASVGISPSSLAYDGNANNLLKNRTGGQYGINAPSTPPPPPVTPTPGPAPTPTPGPSTTPTPSPSQSGSHQSGGTVYTKTATFQPSNSSSASINGDSTQISGNVDIQPVVDPNLLASDPTTSIVKVEYYLGKTLVATKTSAPFTYTFDTKKLRNGTYTMVIKTYYSSGTSDSTTNKLVVKNPVTLSYVMAHYATDLLASFIGLIIIALVIWKFIWPRFRGGGSDDGSGGMYAADLAGYGQTGYDPAATSYEAPDPTVVAPSGAQQDVSGVITPGQAAAAQDTQPLAGQADTAFNPGSYGLQNDGQGQAPGQGGQATPGTPPAGPDGQGGNPNDRRIY